MIGKVAKRIKGVNIFFSFAFLCVSRKLRQTSFSKIFISVKRILRQSKVSNMPAQSSRERSDQEHGLSIGCYQNSGTIIPKISLRGKKMFVSMIVSGHPVSCKTAMGD